MGRDTFDLGVEDKLKEALDPNLVKPRKVYEANGKERWVDFLPGHTIIDQANAVFGFDGWGYELVGDVKRVDLPEVNPQTGEVIRPRGFYQAVVKVSVFGAPPRTDIGASDFYTDNLGDHDKALKGAVTDALKRGLRTFGNQFGNSLYRKPDTQQGQRPQGQGGQRPEGSRRRSTSGSRNGQAEKGKDGKFNAHTFNEFWMAVKDEGFDQKHVADLIGANINVANIAEYMKKKGHDSLMNLVDDLKATRGS